MQGKDLNRVFNFLNLFIFFLQFKEKLGIFCPRAHPLAQLTLSAGEGPNNYTKPRLCGNLTSADL